MDRMARCQRPADDQARRSGHEGARIPPASRAVTRSWGSHAEPSAPRRMGRARLVRVVRCDRHRGHMRSCRFPNRESKAHGPFENGRPRGVSTSRTTNMESTIAATREARATKDGPRSTAPSHHPDPPSRAAGACLTRLAGSPPSVDRGARSRASAIGSAAPDAGTGRRRQGRASSGSRSHAGRR